MSQQLAGIKSRPNFKTSSEGVDSNTISSGEDNVYIILNTLEALRYYYDIVDKTESDGLLVESILLIDEFDATLHPAAQFKLLDIIRDYSNKYKIQVFFTTHSLSLIEYMFKKKDKVIYLLDNIETVTSMNSPNIHQINLFLKNSTQESIYKDKKIAIYTEDEEARFFLSHLLETFKRSHYELFNHVLDYFHFVKVNIGADNLKNIFQDKYAGISSMQSICILDGDQKSDLTNNIIALPAPYTDDAAKNTPEKILMSHAIYLFDENKIDFWGDDQISGKGYTRIFFRDEIKPDFESIEQELQKKRENGESTKGLARVLNKKIFMKHKSFLDYVCIHWMNDEKNQCYILDFMKSLHHRFVEVAPSNGLDPTLWKWGDYMKN